MTLQEYFATKPRGAKIELARLVGISKTWMSLLTNGHDICSAEVAVLIERHTKGAVTRKELRPDIFGVIR